MGKITFTKKALPFILKALDIKTDIPHDKIAAIYKNNNGNVLIIKNDLLSIMEFVDNKNGDIAQLV